MAADPRLQAIEEAAAAWLVERDGGLNPARQRELEAWLHEDPLHRAAFRALAATWDLIAEAPGGSAGREQSKRRTVAWIPTTLAAAAVIALAYLGSIPWRGNDFSTAAATEIGALRKLELPDGSLVQLNTDSSLRVLFTATERRVQLERGEAHFAVAKNQSRPFIVSASGVDVRVVGTEFNVRLRAESVDVLVTEGRVQVNPRALEPQAAPGVFPPEPASELVAGQRASIALTGDAPVAAVVPTAVSAPEIRQVLAWQARRLDFDATPLREIVAELNRYNRHKLVVADERLEAQRFGGSFPATDVNTFVRMLETDFGVVAERKGDVTTLRSKH